MRCGRFVITSSRCFSMSSETKSSCTAVPSRGLCRNAVGFAFPCKGGHEKSIYRLCKSLADSGAEYELITPTGKEEPKALHLNVPKESSIRSFREVPHLRSLLRKFERVVSNVLSRDNGKCGDKERCSPQELLNNPGGPDLVRNLHKSRTVQAASAY